MRVPLSRVRNTWGRVSPAWLSGTYEETWAGSKKIAHFIYREPNFWRIEEDGKVTEVSTPDRTVVVKDGVGISYDLEEVGSVVVNNILKSFVLSRKFIDESTLDLIEEQIEQSFDEGRESWTFCLAPSAEKPQTLIKMDAETGVIRMMKAGPRAAQLTNLDFEEAPLEPVFVWNG